MKWCVVEQPAFVDAGRALFDSNERLAFVDSIQDARERRPNAVLASSVLQYLRDPFAALEELIGLDARILVIDRTPFARDSQARLLSQHVPRNIGLASYPLHTFSRAEVSGALIPRYKMLLEFPTPDSAIMLRGAEADYFGSVWLRKD